MIKEFSTTHPAAAASPAGRFAWALAALAAISLGTALRATNLHSTGYNSDEVAELILARKSLTDLALDRDDDLFPPLHRFVMAVWIRVWGADAAARWLSVVLGSLTLVVVWRMGVDLLGERDAPWPTLLMACSPFHIYYCRDGRAYALYVLCAAVMFWAALRIMQRGRWGSWTTLIVSSSVAVYTHYYAAPLAVVLWCIVLVTTIRGDGWRGPIAALGIVMLLLAPAPLLLHRALADVPDEKLVAKFDVEALGFAYFSLATGFTVGPSVHELRSIPASDGIRQFLPWIIAVGFAYATLGWHALRRLPGSTLVLLLLPTLVLVPAIGVLGALVDRGFVVRYVCWMAVPYSLILGAGAAASRRSSTAAIVVLLAVNAIAIYNRSYDARYAEEDYRAVAARLDELDPARGPVIVASNYMGDALRYYAGGEREISSFPIFAHHGEAREAAIANFLQTHPAGSRIWMVSQWLPIDDVRRATRDAALKRFNATLVAEMNLTEIYSASVPE